MSKIIRITAKKDGFRRGGLAHPARAVEYPAEKFSAGELEALRTEPMLVVQELDVPDPAAPAENGEKGKEAGDGGKPKTGK